MENIDGFRKVDYMPTPCEADSRLTKTTVINPTNECRAERAICGRHTAFALSIGRGEGWLNAAIITDDRSPGREALDRARDLALTSCLGEVRSVGTTPPPVDQAPYHEFSALLTRRL